ncbi:LlaJI family restriction endonuclease [Vagococcus bubulae]|uniref:LlaJI family restriction endonuclease n=1 Tax=Vagococcus bubulae TaxID=1977868 RepID=UPI0022DEBC02|nr:LlaJI family restriction endonuclease [Vagococcus bubulae]
MSVVILKELETYVVDREIEENNLLKLFDLENNVSKFNNIIEELNNTTFLIHRKPTLSLSELSTTYQLDDEVDEIPNHLRNKETFQFSFVGVIFIMDVSIIIYPKHIENIEDDIKHNFIKFRQILKVIECYHKRQQQNIDLTIGEESTSRNKFSIALQLLDYYAEHGLYTFENNIIEENGEGYIVWEKTINEKSVVFSGNSPIYISPYTESTVTNELHIIRQIQLGVLSDIQNQFGDIISIVNYTIPNESSILLEDLGDKDQLISRLEIESYSEFVSHKLYLINLLKMYLLDKINETTTDSLVVYGVSKFAPVWEDVCKKVYKDHLENKLKDFDLKPVGNLNQDSKLKDVVEPPNWYNISEEKNYQASKSLELDVLHIDSDTFHIYDGKYYLIEFDGTHIKKAPGVGDITKQYLYQQAYAKLAKKNGYRFTNKFIVPKDNLKADNGQGVLIATVSLPLFESFDLSKIEVIARDCETFFNEYLDESNFPMYLS